MFTIRITVAPDFQNAVSKWRHLAEHGFYESLTRIAASIRDALLPALADEAPYYLGPPRSSGREPGTFKRSIRARISGSGGQRLISFNFEEPLVAWIVGGTAPHDIYPVNARVLSFIGADGSRVFAKKVHHPGTAPNDFISRAFANSEGDLNDILERTGRIVWAGVV